MWLFGIAVRRSWGGQFLIVGFAFLNALLYCALLPVWEGFDEPFHFGYVQHLANGWGLPKVGETKLSQEVGRAVDLAWASHAVQQNLPQVRTYGEYFAMTEGFPEGPGNLNPKQGGGVIKSIDRIVRL